MTKLWVISAALLVLCIVAVIAENNEELGKRTKTKRKMSFDVKKNTVNIRASSQDADEKESLHFQFQTKGVPAFRLKYFKKENDTMESFKFRFAMFGLVEYISPMDASEAFDGTQTPLQKKWIAGGSGAGKRKFSDLVKTETTVGDVKSYTVTTKTQTEAPEVQIELHISDDDLKSPNATLRSNALKFDIGIKNFPWSRNSSRLALVAKIQSKSKINAPAKDESDSDLVGPHKGVPIGNSNEGKIAWLTNIATSGGTATCPVIMTAFKNVDKASDMTDQDTDNDDKTEESRWIVFSFLCAHQPTDFYWDPELVLGDEDGASTVVMTPLAFLLLLAAVFFTRMM